MKEVSAAIVGGGPAGLQAAITLAEQGVETLLFEEHAVIGEPIQCGEGLSIHAFKDLSIPKNDENFCVRELDTCHLSFPENQTILGDIHAIMLKRDKFDQFLSDKAKDLGVKVLTSAKVEDLQNRTDGVRIRLKDKNSSEYLAKFLILAEGPNAKLARKLNFEPPSPMIKAYEYKLKGEWSEKLEFHFDANKYPFGYCWVFPRDGETNVGIVTTAKDRKQRLDNFLKLKKISGDILKKIGGQIPMNGPVNKLYCGRVLLAGDTAGMVNPIFYGGIRLGMTSGRIAGKSVVNNLKMESERGIFNLKNYEEDLGKHNFMKKINLQAHRFFYTRSNRFLTKLGEVSNYSYINRIEGLQIIKTLGKVLKRPTLLANPIGLYWLYRGFMIARDWGF
ncbi:MAG: NAD(P)/FAD-dependent oxidoreductase [Candidatus Heimdallarchaeota archaeon]|nr:NAD(P)/FAD-dependent oxidoreductase [Candidatus Heimdallarchaeota archaeon]